MLRRWICALLVLALLAGCGGQKADKERPASGETAPAEDPVLTEMLAKTRDLSRTVGETKDGAKYREAWPQYLAAVDALLNHPKSWTITPSDMPVPFTQERNDLRVYARSGNTAYLGESTRSQTNIWVQWRDSSGVPHGQVLYRGDTKLVKTEATDKYIVAYVSWDPAAVWAWTLDGATWRPAPEAFAAIPGTLGEIRATADSNGRTFAGGQWVLLDAAGTQRDKNGVPFLCSRTNLLFETCRKLQLGDRITVTEPDPARYAALAEPKTFLTNLGQAEYEVKRAGHEGLKMYLQKPLNQQLPADKFRDLMKSTAPNALLFAEVLPGVRVYGVDANPPGSGNATAYVQWWDDPAYMRVDTLPFVSGYKVLKAAMMGDSENRALVYLMGADSKGVVGQRIAVIRLDHKTQKWYADVQAFGSRAPAPIGKVIPVVSGSGAVLDLHGLTGVMPDFDKSGDKIVYLDDKTNKVLITIVRNKNGTFTVVP